MHSRSFFGAYRLVTMGEPRGAALWNVQSWDYLRTAKDNKRFVRAGDPIPDVPFQATIQAFVAKNSLSGLALERQVNSSDPV